MACAKKREHTGHRGSCRNAQLTTWDLGRIRAFEGSRKFDLHCNSEAFNRPFARWRSMTRVTTTTRTLCQYPCANSRGHWQSILVSYNYPTSSWKLPRTGKELKLSEDNVLKSGGGGMEAVNTNYVILPNLTRNCLGVGGGGVLGVNK